jgi:hypothetical protein
MNYINLMKSVWVNNASLSFSTYVPPINATYLSPPTATLQTALVVRFTAVLRLVKALCEVVNGSVTSTIVVARRRTETATAEYRKLSWYASFA